MDFLLYIFIFLLNYFWLHKDPKKSARMYCDQHCFKIGSEVIESVWDAALVLHPKLNRLADEANLAKSWRNRRHSKSDCLWHPLSVWNGLCRANMRRSLINADAIFREHKRRTGTTHSAWADCKFLIKHIDDIDFNSMRWLRWFASQSGDLDTKYRPSKTKKNDLLLRQEWVTMYCFPDGVDIQDIDRNRCDMTLPPQCINDKLFPGCKTDYPEDYVAAYRNYYIAKTKTVGQGMRYLYTKPPKFLIAAKCKVVNKRGGKCE